MNDLEKIQKLLLKIPKGKITTYKILAIQINKPKAYRYVGSLLKSNPEPNKYPCFKVVKSSGEIGEYDLGVKEKMRRLNKEGIKVKNKRIVNFKDILYEYLNVL